jgi:hypothetical protein
LWIQNYYFYPDPDPICFWVLNPDPDPTWLSKSSGSSSGSDPNIHSFTMPRNLKAFSLHFYVYFSKKMLNYCIFKVVIIKLLIILMISDKI